MRYTTGTPGPRSLIGSLAAASLCLVCANCGDPVSGAWVDATIPTPPAGNSPQYTSYMVTLTYGDGMTISVDLEATRTMSAITFASCMQSIMAMGTYTEMNNTLTSTFTTVNSTRMGCYYMQDNTTSTTLDTATTTLLNNLASGSFVVANNVLTVTNTSGMASYNKM